MTSKKKETNDEKSETNDEKSEATMKRMRQTMKRMRQTMKRVLLIIGQIYGYLSIATGIVMTILILSSLFGNI